MIRREHNNAAMEIITVPVEEKILRSRPRLRWVNRELSDLKEHQFGDMYTIVAYREIRIIIDMPHG